MMGRVGIDSAAICNYTMVNTTIKATNALTATTEITDPSLNYRSRYMYIFIYINIHTYIYKAGASHLHDEFYV